MAGKLNGKGSNEGERLRMAKHYPYSQWCKRDNIAMGRYIGKYPPEAAWKDDDEPFVITQDGEKICKKCATNWQREKKKSEKEKE